MKALPRATFLSFREGAWGRKLLVVVLLAVGTGGVATMHSLQRGMAKSIASLVESRGPRNCDLASTYAPGQRGRPLVLDDARALQSLLAGRAKFSPTMARRPEIQLGKVRSRISILGIDPSSFYLVTTGRLRLRGRPLVPEDDLLARQVAVINPEAARQLGITGSTSLPLSAKVGRLAFDIVGIEEESREVAPGAAPSDSAAAYLFVPIETMLQRVLRSDEVSITFRVADGQSIEQVAEEVRQIVRKRHQLRPEDPDDFLVLTPEMVTQPRATSHRSTRRFGWPIVMSIFLLAAVGTVQAASGSVAKPKLEMGIKVAFGARRAQILSDGAFELVALALSGGLLGFVVSWMGPRWVKGVLAASPATDDHAIALMVVDWMTFAIAISLSLVPCFVGVFLLWRRMAQIDPVDALRTRRVGGEE